MMRILLWVGLAIGVVLAETSTGDKLPGQRQPVLVELFTSEGQQQYARRFRTQGPYTPQMVVDSRTEFVGSDASSAESAVRDALGQPKVEVHITGNEGSADIQIDPLLTGKVHKAGVFVAWAADTGTQDVLRGENKGRRLRHVSIVKELKQVGTLDDRMQFKTRVPLESGSRMIVFVQGAGNGPVWGAALMPSGRGASR